MDTRPYFTTLTNKKFPLSIIRTVYISLHSLAWVVLVVTVDFIYLCLWGGKYIEKNTLQHSNAEKRWTTCLEIFYWCSTVCVVFYWYFKGFPRQSKCTHTPSIPVGLLFHPTSPIHIHAWLGQGCMRFMCSQWGEGNKPLPGTSLPFRHLWRRLNSWENKRTRQWNSTCPILLSPQIFSNMYWGLKALGSERSTVLCSPCSDDPNSLLPEIQSHIKEAECPSDSMWESKLLTVFRCQSYHNNWILKEKVSTLWEKTLLTQREMSNPPVFFTF